MLMLTRHFDGLGIFYIPCWGWRIATPYSLGGLLSIRDTLIPMGQIPCDNEGFQIVLQHVLWLSVGRFR